MSHIVPDSPSHEELFSSDARVIVRYAEIFVNGQ